MAALSAFLTYVGAGLDGQAGLGDFNLQLNDSYQGQVVKGCPAYDDVRQPSMDGFDLEKYQGKWYEQKFHDWTQFKEVYDTTLDIKLTSDKKVRRNCIGSSVISVLFVYLVFACPLLHRVGLMTLELEDLRLTLQNYHGISHLWRMVRIISCLVELMKTIHLAYYVSVVSA